LENLEEMDKFPDAYDQTKLNQECINHLNRFTPNNKTEVTIISNKMKSPGPNEFTAEFSKTFKEELMPLKLFHEKKGKEQCHIHSMKPVLYPSPNRTRTQPKKRIIGQFV
jgi:hypothetical protein